MYIIDGVAYAGEPKPVLRVISVRPLDNHILNVSFNTGETKLFDFKPLLSMPAFKPLFNTKLFNEVYVDFGCPVWDEGNIDIAPEYLYQHGVPVQ